MRAPAVLGSLAPSAPSGSARFATLLTVAPAAARLLRASGVPARGRSVRPDGAVAPVGPLPGTSAGAAGAMAAGSPPPAPYALLAAALALAAVLLSRLICVPARWRPVLFISLLERPG